jgi:Protein of unknown function (DUF1552)
MPIFAVASFAPRRKLRLMNAKTWHISRRTVLKGVGAFMGLPLLEAMKPFRSLASDPEIASGAAAQVPVRLGVLFMPNGVNEKAWLPQGEGTEFDLSPTLEPLAKLKDKILVLTNLWNAAANTGDGHYVKVAGLLTSTTITRTTGTSLCSGGVSMDQVAAQRIGNFTPLPSLELGIEPVTTGVDTNVGFTRLYGSHIAWSSPVMPLAKEINPRLAFDRLFRSNRDARRRDVQEDTSVLDLVRDDAKRLRSQVGAADQRKLDEYFDSVRAVEKRIEFDAKRKAEDYRSDPLAQKEIKALGDRIQDYYQDPGRASERKVDHTDHVRLMLDIMVLAFWTDSTRVGTFMFGNAVSGKNFSFLEGVKGGHHQISHHEGKEDKLAQYALINRWHVEQWAYMLNRMEAIQEGESTLLDRSMVLFASGFRDGNSHNPHNLPLVLAGKAGGTIRPGRHLVYDRNTPLSNLYRSLLTRMGTPVGKFADSTGELPNLAG